MANLRIEENELLAAARALADKLDEIVKHPSYLTVFTIAATHGVPYYGPNYEMELKRLRELIDLNKDEEPK